MTKINQHGLKRPIPEKIKKAVRQKCGFGCVICGSAIYDYDHFDPEFSDCKEHKVEGITLLCGSHHIEKTRDFLPLKKIIDATLNPFAKRNGFKNQLHLNETCPSIFLGSNEFIGFQDIIHINGVSLLKIDPPESESAPFRLSGRFFNEEGKELLTIYHNEWKGDPLCWDVETVGGKITIKSNGGTKPITLVKLEVKQQPEQIVISEMNMFYEGHRFLIMDGKYQQITPQGGGIHMLKSRAVNNNRIGSFAFKFNDGQLKGFGSD